MSKDVPATTLERAIGRQLAGWRNERELSLTEAGQHVGFSSAKLSMMENVGGRGHHGAWLRESLELIAEAAAEL